MKMRLSAWCFAMAAAIATWLLTGPHYLTGIFVGIAMGIPAGWILTVLDRK